MCRPGTSLPLLAVRASFQMFILHESASLLQCVCFLLLDMWMMCMVLPLVYLFGVSMWNLFNVLPHHIIDVTIYDVVTLNVHHLNLFCCLFAHDFYCISVCPGEVIPPLLLFLRFLPFMCFLGGVFSSPKDSGCRNTVQIVKPLDANLWFVILSNISKNSTWLDSTFCTLSEYSAIRFLRHYFHVFCLCSAWVWH